MSDVFELVGNAEAAGRAVTARLTRRGFLVVRSFDLRSALAAHGGCECPHHGTAECTCEYVVLLVYGDSDAAPVVLTAHGRDGHTRLQVVCDSAAHPDARIVAAIRTALVAEAALVADPAADGSDASD